MESLFLDESSFTGMRVLDVGCGPHGGLMLFKDCERYGVDHLINGYLSIGYPLQDHGITYIDCKAEDMPFAEGFFDMVVCINALDHVDNLELTVKEISRILRMGGRFLGQFNFHKVPARTEPICLTHGKLAEICDLYSLRLKRRIFQYRMPQMFEDRYYYEFEKRPPVTESDALVLAEGFILNCIKHGLACSYDTACGQWVKPYPEVTGYLLSYFAQDRMEHEIPKVIVKAGKKLLSLQHSCGGFPSFLDNHRLFTFDTAQIMHGLASLHLATEERRYLDAAVRAADFVCDMQISDGSMFPVYDLRQKAKHVETHGQWGISFSPIQVKNIEGLMFLYKLTGEDRYSRAAADLIAFGKRTCNLTYTHPGAYCLEGLLAAGETGFVRERLSSEILPRLQSDGFLAYAQHLPYAYVSGSVQMGILLHKTGFCDEAHLILEWARRVQKQHECGGLFQYADVAGNPDSRIHREINSWGTKYFCQLERLGLCGS
jgi:ubiquinone/menaquinone biosynthesis C-methylase UbiE